MIYFFNYILIFSYYVHYSKCDRSLEKRIVDGEDVPIQNYPHAVFLEIVTEVDSKHICGSSVLNQFYLISVAHCVYSSEKEILKMESNGMEKIISAFAGHEDVTKAVAYRRVEKAIIHENYSPVTVDNDIALLLLRKELPLGKYIKRIIIKRSFPSGVTGALVGWGIIDEITEEESLTLKSIVQTVKNKQTCSIVGTTRSTLCAGSFRASDPRAAAGDSGNGLVTLKHQLIGLLSYKLNSYPALPVYTNVSYFYKWIKQNAKSAFCEL